MSLILASSSPFRKKLLKKLSLDFDIVSPEIDESRQDNETPKQLVFRLAQEKAREVAKTHSGLIIASDQVATLADGAGVDDEILTKPQSHKNATRQLEQSSGNVVTFLTSLTLLNAHTNNMQTYIHTSKVFFKVLSAEKIEDYLQKEQPYNCAGGFKSETPLGVSLFERIEGDDVDAMVGLPLIQLAKMLEKEGVSILKK
ncbi:Septum formation protein Maf [Bathymodiolus thermophilus thioautotrophic gill symbiont]|uniref:7-methyl-GTP pyrophosphatase n=1 Tax=Bathymodiolus thermophilus thioautotrophic gill symbiont TaxID=2360 RepID=A0A8H9CEW2_9GAMM|nr:Maf family nucleotide pyrophosphatase [Bathymodiolus thermophilus thioautotrophic gill symbiont]CAB5495202.1 Maf-like protein YceF [Bathymodiolus thermophilus thioautotrophic gill symbiont]CAB5502152.1 Maf-like protein YceF [Bathymodiolus thermophilus thioautotrophic gill symbiont]SGZ69932.1 Septum formation protein Maf [Bathymodiolus thermophilus thioautotrophic gill symbiont]